MTSLRHLPLAALALVTVLGPLTYAQTLAAKPSNATGQCKDGTYSTAASKAGACRGHNGVKEWYTATVTSPATPAAKAAPATAATVKPTPTPAPTAATAKPSAPAAAPAMSPAPAQTATKPQAGKGPKANLATTPAAAGGAPNLVWVNTASNVYHCYGADFYGKTKAGSYMTESDAKAKGARADHGKACSK